MIELKDFFIQTDADIRTALYRIDKNQKEFLIVIDQTGRLQGALTDKDIWHYLLYSPKEKDNIHNSIRNCYQKHCISIRQDAKFNEVIGIFQDPLVKFLPVLDKNNRVVNIITKANMKGILLQNIPADLTYDFIHMNENLLNYEVHERPWGFYKTTIANSFYQSKIIDIAPMQSLSLQKHLKREEHWIVVTGKGSVQIGESIFPVQGGSYQFIPRGCKHRIQNISESENLIFIEVQTGYYFGEDDIIRYEDQYGRT